VALNITIVQVWAREIDDRPGALADVLRAVADAGGNVECVIARREPGMPGKGQVFVTLGKGRSSHDATAQAAGLTLVEDVATLRVEGSDLHGLGGRLTGALEKAQINVRGLSTAVLGGNFVCYIGLDSVHDAKAAIPALKHVKGGDARAGGKKRRKTAGRRGGASAAQRSTVKRSTVKRSTIKRKATRR
jgi:hypothetical protein